MEKFSFDGKGINGGDEYASRIATLTEHGHGLGVGNLLAAAPELMAALQRVACCADTAAHLLRDIAPEESALFKADYTFAISAITKATGKGAQ